MSNRKPPSNKGKGKTFPWLLAHVNYQGDDCLKWPFGGDPKSGRGVLQHNGVRRWAHRWMCMLAHGEPPTPNHKAAHNCGNGHLGCINPRHLEWKTQKENLADCAIHGTQPKHYDGNQGRLTTEQANEIRCSRGIKTMFELAALFEVSEGTINDIWRGRTHARPSKIVHYTADEDAAIRRGVDGGLSFREIGALVGREAHAVSGRVYRLGLTSKWIRPKGSKSTLSFSNGDRQ